LLRSKNLAGELREWKQREGEVKEAKRGVCLDKYNNYLFNFIIFNLIINFWM